VEAVGELDENDANIVGHGHEHLAKVLGLGLLSILKLNAVELGETGHQGGDHGAKPLCNLLEANAAVLYGVVQKGCHEGFGIKPPAAADLCNGKGVCDIGLARLTTLPKVGLVCEPKGLRQSRGIRRLQVTG
jgi:hypothetical protein